MGEVPVWAGRRKHSKAGHSSSGCSEEALSGDVSLVMYRLYHVLPLGSVLLFLADDRHLHTAAGTCEENSVMHRGEERYCTGRR